MWESFLSIKQKGKGLIDYTIKNRHIKNGENIVLARYVTNGHMFNNKPVEINNKKQKTSIFEMLNTFF